MKPDVKKILLPHITRALKHGQYNFTAKNEIRIYVLTGNIEVEAEAYVIDISWNKDED